MPCPYRTYHACVFSRVADCYPQRARRWLVVSTFCAIAKIGIKREDETISSSCLLQVFATCTRQSPIISGMGLNLCEILQLDSSEIRLIQTHHRLECYVATRFDKTRGDFYILQRSAFGGIYSWGRGTPPSPNPCPLRVPERQTFREIRGPER